MKRDQLIFLGALVVAAVIAVLVVLATGGDDDGDPAEGTKPQVDVPEGPPPKQLEVRDITEGDGAEASAGDTVEVEYLGVSYSNGREFDSSWERPEPFTFQLGAGQVIPGWDQGIDGMKVGGRRELVIPPHLAYGKQGSPPAIKPNETLVFVVDLLDVQSTQ
ncbi:MAG TPA: FKBP-type peptidyl-prolyl cis-trans isomerase [Solirubrobacterales bacterium]|nr:FKBP-type peptidyl-prolyl cis-trans isomerase [Solirubrobacterales bacterium]